MSLQETEGYLGQFFTGQILYNENMRNHTSWRIGGPADMMAIPACIDDIRHCLRFAREHQIPLIIMGNGSNMLVRDKGVRGIVLKISRGLNKIEISNNEVCAEAGALLPVVAKQAAEAGLSGLEFAIGIPASVGGAVSMNAGAHGKSMNQVISEVTALTPEGETVLLGTHELGFYYRRSGVRDRKLVVLGAKYILEPGDKDEIMSKNQENLNKRRRSQPLDYPNAGSVFANPPGQWAGWLIEQVGGKGMRVGDAVVSDKHANFIINLGEATAADVMELINRISWLVREKFNIELKLEVRVVGE